jgi:hypothetical protein
MSLSIPKTAEELTAQRKASLPEAISETQLQRVSTGRVRYALSQLAQNNIERVQDLLDAIGLTEGPKAEFDAFMKLLEYSIPKLSRTEVKVEDSAGNAIVRELSMEDLQELVRKGVQAQHDQDRTIEGEVERVS